jgi:hypothetical protein
MTTKESERRLYLRFRKAGFPARLAIENTRIVTEFERINDEYVRDNGEPIAVIGCEHEPENYFDVYGEPDGYVDANGRHVTAEQERQQIVDEINLNGCWVVFGEYDGEMVDYVGMCVGYRDPSDPVENEYVLEFMVAVIEAHKKSLVSCSQL